MKMEKYIRDRLQIAMFETRMGDGRYDLYILLDGRLACPVLQRLTAQSAARVARALLGTCETESMEQERQE